MNGQSETDRGGEGAARGGVRIYDRPHWTARHGRLGLVLWALLLVVLMIVAVVWLRP
jgi:hypothetical protein